MGRTIFGLSGFEYNPEKILKYRREVALAILKSKSMAQITVQTIMDRRSSKTYAPIRQVYK